MYAITANDLKTSFVVMNIDHYHYLRECELEAALLEAQSDIASGKAVTESVDKHIKRIQSRER
jgi:hypothetical protein